MNPVKLASTICSVVVLCCAAARGSERPNILLQQGSGALAADVTHRFFTCGWSSGGPTLYDEQCQMVWNSPTKAEVSDGWVLPDGSVVYSYSMRKEGVSSVIRLDAEKNKMWEYRLPEGRDNHSCQPLPHGGFLLGECAEDGLWMLELDADGKELKRVKVADAVNDIHHAFRMVRKTPEGTYLGTLMKSAQAEGQELKAKHAYEWDSTGKLIRTFPSGFFVAVRLPDGNTLVSEGGGVDGRGVTEYDADGNVVWALTSDDLKAAGLRVGMVCGIQRLPNGNTIVSNVKHGKHFLGAPDGEMPKVFEVTPDKKVVWKVLAETVSMNMGGIQVLDVKGNPFRFEVHR